MARMAPADYREFIRVAVDLPMNPKLAMIDEPAAGWAYVVSLCYCGQNLTDGSFPMPALLRLAGVKTPIARLLIDGGLWHETGHHCERCPQPMKGMGVVHDYLEQVRRGAGGRVGGIPGRPEVSCRSRRHISYVLRAAVYERDAWTCQGCDVVIPAATADERAGRKAPRSQDGRLELDHVRPYSQGGLDTLDNFQSLCGACNGAKGATV